MRKITFVIDDTEFFRNEYKKQMTEKQLADLVDNLTPFKCVYTLIGESQPDKYELTDHSGNKLNINDLNGYQRGVILNDCMSYFIGGKYHSDGNKPCGVVKITEEII